MKGNITCNIENNNSIFEEYYMSLKESHDNALQIIINKTLKEINRYDLSRESPTSLLYLYRIIITFYTFCLDHLIDIKYQTLIYEHLRLQTLVYKNRLSLYTSKTNKHSDEINNLACEAYSSINTFFWTKPVKY